MARTLHPAGDRARRRCGASGKRTDFSWDPAWRVPNLAGVAICARGSALIAAHVYGEPSRQAVGCRRHRHQRQDLLLALDRAGLTRSAGRTAVIGTLGNGFPGDARAATHTTPDAVVVQAQLADLLAQGARGVAMEVSSLGLDQGRVNGVAFEAALFTNLTRDHLDYHGTMERYGAAKARLFHWPGLQHAVINLDDAFGARSRRVARSLARQRAGLRIGQGRDRRPSRWICRKRGLHARDRDALGRRGDPQPAARRLQCRQPARRLGVLLAAGVELDDAVRGARAGRAGGRPAADGAAAGQARWSWSTMRTRPTRWRRCWRRCAACWPAQARLDLRVRLRRRPRSGQAPADGRGRDPARRPASSSPATTRAARIRARSSTQIVAGAHPNYHVEIDRAARHLSRACARRGRRRRADRRQGARDLPGDRRRGACRSAMPRSRAALLRGSAADARSRRPLPQALGALARRGAGRDASTRCQHRQPPVKPRRSVRRAAGERFDGHAFVDAGAGARARSPRWSTRPSAVRRPHAPLIVVDDTRSALGRLAAHWRARFAMPLIAVTGSNGKTTVKEMIAAILRDGGRSDDARARHRGQPQQRHRRAAHAAAPASEHRYAVIEMGMNHPGEISYLTRLARPDVALVNNAGAAHIGSSVRARRSRAPRARSIAGLERGWHRA